MAPRKRSRLRTASSLEESEIRERLSRSFSQRSSPVALYAQRDRTHRADSSGSFDRNKLSTSSTDGLINALVKDSLFNSANMSGGAQREGQDPGGLKLPPAVA